MTLYVLIENKLEGKVTASLIGWPDITAQGGTEARVAVTVITLEEQIRGRLEIIRRHGRSPLQVAAYTAFQQTLRYFATWQVLDFTQPKSDRRRWPGLKRKIQLLRSSRT